MEFSMKKDLWKNSYFLAAPRSFFYRYADSGFKNKWTGLWHNETKFLEFFALKCDGEWLSEDRCRSLAYNGAKAVHSFRLPGREIIQSVFLTDSNQLVLRLCSGKPMKTELIPAVNIRRRIENRTGRKYMTDQHRGSVGVHNELGSLFVSLPKGSGFIEKQEYKEHCPSGEDQGYFIPGTVTAKGRDIAFLFSPVVHGERPAVSSNQRISLSQREKQISDFRKLIRTDNRLLGKGFFWSAVASELCRKNGSGISSWYAGLPWFQQFWARDIFWVMPSMTALGCFDDVRKTLGFFAVNSENGRIPNTVSETEGKCMNALDPTMLWMTSLEDYVMNSGDMRFLKSMVTFLESGIRYLVSCDQDGDGYLEHDSRFPETWMDTLKRDSRAIDMQALYHGALRSAISLFSMSRPKDNNIKKKAESAMVFLEKNLEKDFFHNGFFADRFFWKQPVGTRTANAIVPILFGFGRHSREVLEAIESEPFTSGRGVRTRAGGEPGFDPGGYHTGQSWSLTTAWACAAEFLARRPAKAWGYLSMLLDDIERDALGCIGESWNSSNLSLSGCPLQLWGSGFVPRLVDEFMLGIRVNSVDRTIRVSPQLPPAVRRIERLRRTGLGRVRLSFRKSGRDVKITCSSKKFRIIMDKP